MTIFVIRRDIVYSLVFYVPESHLEIVKDALFNKGAGSYKNYDRCCWQVEGEGQFRPLEGSNPFIGKTGSVEKVKEYKVEMICDNSVIHSVLEELRRVHPYQEPAYLAIQAGV